MKIYLVVEYYDHGPGWGLGAIIKGFNEENEANLLRDKLNEDLKQFYFDENGIFYEELYFPAYHVEEVEVE